MTRMATVKISAKYYSTTESPAGLQTSWRGQPMLITSSPPITTAIGFTGTPHLPRSSTGGP